MVYCDHGCFEGKGMCLHSPISWLLTYELVSDEIVIQNHEADHGELGQVDLKLKALVEDGVIPVLSDGPGATLGAVCWDTVDLHIDVGVNDVTFDPGPPRPGQILTANYLEGVIVWCVNRPVDLSRESIQSIKIHIWVPWKKKNKHRRHLKYVKKQTKKPHLKQHLFLVSGDSSFHQSTLTFT